MAMRTSEQVRESVSNQAVALGQRFGVVRSKVEAILDAVSKEERVLIHASQIGLPATATARDVQARIYELAELAGVKTAVAEDPNPALAAYDKRQRSIMHGLPATAARGAGVTEAIRTGETVRQVMIRAWRRHRAEAQLAGRTPLDFEGFRQSYGTLHPELAAAEHSEALATAERKSQALAIAEREVAALAEAERRADPSIGEREASRRVFTRDGNIELGRRLRRLRQAAR